MTADRRKSALAQLFGSFHEPCILAYYRFSLCDTCIFQYFQRLFGIVGCIFQLQLLVCQAEIFAFVKAYLNMVEIGAELALSIQRACKVSGREISPHKL